jgi:DNA-binding GntR family transcriptional regulator
VLSYVDLVHVDHGLPEPAYRQLAAILRDQIAEGQWRAGPLPSVKQLQEQHDVGRDTVLRAIDLLRDEGLVFTVARRGTYVSPQK